MKYIVITCATSGFGSVLAKHLAAEGKNLILIGRNEKKLNDLQKEISKNANASLKLCTIDFSNNLTVEAFKNWILAQEIEIQGLVVITPRPKLKDNLFPTPDEWHDLVQTCFIGPLALLQATLPYYQPAGKIVLISGLSSLQVMPEHAAFGSLRAMWLAHGKALSYQLGPTGIHVNTISPGGMLTEHQKEIIMEKARNNQCSFEEQYEKSISNVPLRKYASPLEVANVVEFFLSDKSNHISGVNVPCDGGFTRRF